MKLNGYDNWEGIGMSTPQTLLQQIIKLGLVLMMGISMNADAGLFGLGGTSWKEEVLLHDGQKIIVKRSQSYGGRSEIGQSAPIKEHTISFTLPNSNKTITWTSEYSDDVGRANFKLLALHILNDMPYIVVLPNLCLSYNKWGRPNPPYVIFKHDGKDWKRIALQELPTAFKEINLVIETKGERETLEAQSVISADIVRKLNGELTQPEYKPLLREPLANYGKRCGEMVYDGNGGWIGIGWFSEQPSKESCLNYCSRQKVGDQYCPCETLFKGK